MELMVPNYEKHHVFCLLSSSKMTLCYESIAFFGLIPFLFLKIQITGVKNSRHKSDPVYNPHDCKTLPRVYKHTKILETL